MQTYTYNLPLSSARRPLNSTSISILFTALSLGIASDIHRTLSIVAILALLDSNSDTLKVLASFNLKEDIQKLPGRHWSLCCSMLYSYTAGWANDARADHSSLEMKVIVGIMGGRKG